MAAASCAGGASDGVLKLPWPEGIRAVVDAYIDDQNHGREALWTSLALAAGNAAINWTTPHDNAEDSEPSCETWLCIADVLLDRLGLCDVPRDKWPVQLHLLGVIANEGCEDADYLTRAADLLERWASETKVGGGGKSRNVPEAESVMSVVLLLRYHVVMLLARTGQIRTLEALHQSIEKCSELARKWGWQSSEGPMSQSGVKRQRTRVRAQIEPVLRAEEVLRLFAWRMTEAVFDCPSGAEADGGVPLPPKDAVESAASKAQVDFPSVWLRDKAIEAVRVLSAGKSGAAEPGKGGVAAG